MKVTVIRAEPAPPPVEKVIIELESSFARQLINESRFAEGPNATWGIFRQKLRAALKAAEAL
jgi:hypothetical protein